MLENIKICSHYINKRHKAPLVLDEEPQITFLETPTKEKAGNLVFQILKPKILSKNQSNLGERLIDQIKAELGCLEYVNNVIKKNITFFLLKEFEANSLPGIKECPSIIIFESIWQ
ncbi:hypothetical protein [Bacteroidetes bacterium endosymbiont of Geopemphigus sp.]|uniref:hypothetical protein n=1 Tax=Bacteroidetes bacterium endosymbiont of Geopemphigus sp. TaxID=2047937 RepID=UPI000CD21F88|nr:hypothetical protein [Bacteroidetes bacterium endosymbiont of Geopemphigus sp.]